MIPDPILLNATVIAMKITLIVYGAFIFYLFGKYEKIPYSARQLLVVFANGGCLFLAGGLIMNNFFLIKGGLFIFIVHALIDAYFLLAQYQSNKSIEKEKEKSNAKK